MLLTVDCQSGMVMQNELVADYDQNTDKIVTALAHTMLDNEVPIEIQIRDKRQKFCLVNLKNKLA